MEVYWINSSRKYKLSWRSTLTKNLGSLVSIFNIKFPPCGPKALPKPQPSCFRSSQQEGGRHFLSLSALLRSHTDRSLLLWSDLVYSLWVCWLSLEARGFGDVLCHSHVPHLRRDRADGLGRDMAASATPSRENCRTSSRAVINENAKCLDPRGWLSAQRLSWVSFHWGCATSLLKGKHRISFLFGLWDEQSLLALSKTFIKYSGAQKRK